MTEQKQRDHWVDHPGCSATAPWMQGCSLYRLNVNLLAAATEDVKAMPEDAKADWLDFLQEREKRSRWHLRSEYISLREDWRESDRAERLADASSLARILGDDFLEGRTVEQAAEDARVAKVQRLALEVLYVHKAAIPGPSPAGG